MKVMSSTRLVSILIGIIYIVSGVSKALDINAFADVIARFLPNTQFYVAAPIIVGIEIMLGFSLIFGVLLKQLGRFSFFLLSLLTGIYLVGFFVLGIEDCGCFGSVITMPAWVTFVRNLLMLAGSYFIWKTASEYEYNIMKFKALKLGVSMLFGFIAFLVLGFELKSTYSELSIRQNADLQKTFLGKYVQPSQRQILFIFSPSCPHCLSMTDKINKMKLDNIKLVGLYPDVADKKDIDAFKLKKSPKFDIVPVKKDSLRLVTRSLPTFLVVENGILQSVYHNELPLLQEFTAANIEK